MTSAATTTVLDSMMIAPLGVVVESAQLEGFALGSIPSAALPGVFSKALAAVPYLRPVQAAVRTQTPAPAGRRR